MRGFWQSIRISLLDMRGDMRRFVLLIACLAVGTALIAGVSSVGASIRQAVERDAALLMGGDIELSRADRAGDRRGTRADRRLRPGLATSSTPMFAPKPTSSEAFVDLIAVGETYPLLGQVYSPRDAVRQQAVRLPRLERRRRSARWSTR